MVFVTLLPQAEFGPNNHGEDAHNFIFSEIHCKNFGNINIISNFFCCVLSFLVDLWKILSNIYLFGTGNFIVRVALNFEKSCKVDKSWVHPPGGSRSVLHPNNEFHWSFHDSARCSHEYFAWSRDNFASKCHMVILSCFCSLYSIYLSYS